MNQRRESRTSANQSVWVTLYEAVETRICGRIRNVSGRGLGLELDQRIGVGTAIRIDLEDSMLLGEVIYCRPETDGVFYAGVELEQALNGLAALGEMLRGFSDEPSASEPADAVKDTRCQDE
jgi:hypothetical protein